MYEIPIFGVCVISQFVSLFICPIKSKSYNDRLLSSIRAPKKIWNEIPWEKCHRQLEKSMKPSRFTIWNSKSNGRDGGGEGDEIIKLLTLTSLLSLSKWTVKVGSSLVKRFIPFEKLSKSVWRISHAKWYLKDTRYYEIAIKLSIYYIQTITLKIWYIYCRIR